MAILATQWSFERSLMNEYDYIIIGGGCSGLSLGIQMAKKEPDKQILILESRSIYENDKTWSFWDVDSHPFENQIKSNWSQWQIRYQNSELTLNSEHYRYCSIPSDSFYTDARRQINLLPNLNILMDNRIESVVELASDMRIKTNKGYYTSSKVFDSRPEKKKSSLYQHFLGWQVLSASAIFDPQKVILMDFDVDQSKGLHFVYLLPFSSKEALIESTFISAHIHETEVYEKAILTYLKTRFEATDYEIIRKERGVLPLTTDRPDIKSSKWIPIGAKAGWARASTGYAFLPIQKAVENLMLNQKRSKFLNINRYLDKIFLTFLYNEPQSAPKVFFNLFRKNSSDRLIRFLTGYGSFIDIFQVLFSMPKITMIKQALRLIFTRDR